MPTVLVYSNHPLFHDQVRLAVGRSPAAGIEEITYLLATRGSDVITAADEEVADLFILDAEAAPTGGLGLSRELKNSREHCPPILAVIARRDDRWLGKWSQADAVIMRPIDAVELSRTVAELLLATQKERV